MRRAFSVKPGGENSVVLFIYGPPASVIVRQVYFSHPCVIEQVLK